MDKAIFVFNGDFYNCSAVKNFGRHLCEHLCVVDEANVTKYDLENESLEDLLNDGTLFDADDNYKVFLD